MIALSLSDQNEMVIEQITIETIILKDLHRAKNKCREFAYLNFYFF